MTFSSLDLPSELPEVTKMVPLLKKRRRVLVLCRSVYSRVNGWSSSNRKGRYIGSTLVRYFSILIIFLNYQWQHLLPSQNLDCLTGIESSPCRTSNWSSLWESKSLPPGRHSKCSQCGNIMRLMFQPCSRMSLFDNDIHA